MWETAGKCKYGSVKSPVLIFGATSEEFRVVFHQILHLVLTHANISSVYARESQRDSFDLNSRAKDQQKRLLWSPITHFKCANSHLLPTELLYFLNFVIVSLLEPLSSIIEEEKCARHSPLLFVCADGEAPAVKREGHGSEICSLKNFCWPPLKLAVNVLLSEVRNLSLRHT